jgi:hypothetical protein
MGKLFAIAFGAVVAGGCATPIERAEAMCKRFGDLSPTCVERRFDMERARDDKFLDQLTSAIQSRTSKQ